MAALNGVETWTGLDQGTPLVVLNVAWSFEVKQGDSDAKGAGNFMQGPQTSIDFSLVKACLVSWVVNETSPLGSHWLRWQ